MTEVKGEVVVHHGSALSPFLFAAGSDSLADEARQESLQTVLFADDIVVCSDALRNGGKEWRLVRAG